MPILLNGLYLLAILLASPWLAFKALTTGKYRRGILARFFGRAPEREAAKQRIWFHGVSVGEILLLKPLIARIRHRYPDWEIVLSTTTNTGMEVALRHYPDLKVFWFPLDFTWAVRRALQAVKPSLVVLAELELWPNFIHAAKAQGALVAVVNGRVSARSHRGYRRIRWFIRRLLRQIDLLAVQNTAYADRLSDLGAPWEQVHVTGSIKYDGVQTTRSNLKTQQLLKLLGLEEIAGEPKPLVWVVGSTQAPEEKWALEIYREAKRRHPELRLVIVPRHQERFEEVARLLRQSGLPFERRSQMQHEFHEVDAILLVDSLGELGAVWGLADLAFVGGSFAARGGQNMIEPAAYGVATMVGPNTWNFKDTVEQLLAQQALIQVADKDQWRAETLRLLADAEARQELGVRAADFVLSQQGAADRTLDLIRALLKTRSFVLETRLDASPTGEEHRVAV